VTKDVKVQDPQTTEIRIGPQLVLRNKWTATVKEISETSQEARPAPAVERLSDNPLTKPVRMLQTLADPRPGAVTLA
jgi:hypothetical protein